MLSTATVLSCGLTGQGRVFAAPSDGDDLFSDVGAGVAAPAAVPVPRSVKDAVAKSTWRAPGKAKLNRVPRGKAPDKSKRWRYIVDREGQAAAASSRVADAAVSSVDAGVAAPGLGVQGFYGMQEFGVRDGLSVGVNLGNGNLVVRAQDLANNAPGAVISNDRFYNSLSSRTGGFGQRWGLAGGHDVGLEIGASQIVFRGQSGFRAVFTGSGTSWTAPAGLNAKLTKNVDGSFTLVANGSRTTMRFDAGGNLTKVTDRNGVGVSYFYEAMVSKAGQRVASAADAAGRVTTYGYDAADRIVSITDSAGRTMAYSYDASGRLSVVKDPLGQQTHYGYDASGRLSRIQTARTVVVDVAYDTSGRVASVSRYTQLGGAGTQQSTRFVWNAGSTVVSNPLGNRWTHSLDSSGRVTTVVDPMGVTKNRSWTSNSMIASAWEADATAITKFSYDTNNNPIKVSMPTGASSGASYSAGECGVTTTSGTATDLQQCSTDDAGNTTRYLYDAAGNQLSAQDTTADGGAKVQKTYAKPGSTDIATNCSKFAGQLCSVTNAKGNTTRYLYDDQGNLVKVTPPSPLGVVSYTYDSLGRVTSVTKGSGATNSYEYDAADRFVKATYGATPAGPQTEQLRVHDADGNLHNIDAQVFDYDAQNRLSKVTNDKGQARWVGRDGAGNIDVMSVVGAQPTRYTYNKANQITSAAWNQTACPLEGSANANLPSGCVKFGYNSTTGRLSTQVFPGNVTTTPTWDASGRMTSVTSARGGASPQTLLAQSYGYSVGGADRVNVQTMVDSTGDFVPAGATTTYGYDSMNRLTSAVEKTTTGAVNASFTYAYDLNGNRTRQTISGAGAGNRDNALASTRTFDHNRADQLTVADGSTDGFGWDANGDETASRGWLPGSVRGRTAVKTSSIGDVAQWTLPDTNQVFNFTHAQVLPTGTRNLTWAHDQSFTYNPVGMDSYTSPNNQGQVSLFTLPTGQTLGYQVGGKMIYFHKDRQGSVLAMSNDAGDKEAFYRYDPYGQPRDYFRWSDEAKANILMYVGLPRDFSTGLIRMGARWYDPSIARFTTADPSGQEQNPYLYAAANPINNVDPDGLYNFEDAAGTIATFSGAGAGLGATAGCIGGGISGGIGGCLAVGAVGTAMGTTAGTMIGVGHALGRAATENGWLD
ncbi:RHS repeat-associated core domain-containing protein [Luteococcus sp. OSA5]|uniref:RHS repeat-associated core domain-containing protein n=1 Tax=Luteococcus sp. OSA5 TaxID=3401630 RepID=UPI003B4375FA